MTTNEPVCLLVEDEPQMRRFLRACLTSHGYKLHEATTAEEALKLATSYNPELVLLDLGLPDMDGIELTKRLREWTRVPIIVISARGKEDDKVSALDAGADDYLTKPFGVRELLARIRVALRHITQQTTSSEPTLLFGTLKIDIARRQVTVAGTEIHLTPIEYKLLLLLAQNPGKVITHRQILKDVWDPSTLARPTMCECTWLNYARKLRAIPQDLNLL